MASPRRSGPSVDPLLLLALLFLAAVPPANAAAEPVPVRYPEGVSHGFVRLRDAAGKVLADGETTQRRRGNRITGRLVFRFRDGSVYDETTVFTQNREFRLVTEHLIQRGPAFPQALDLSIEAATGMVTVRYTDKGEPKVESEHLDLPADVSNGIIQTLLKNVRADAPPKSFAYVAATPKPRLVKLDVSTAGTDVFTSGGLRRRATHYVLKVDLGGFAGLVAPVIGKQPPDSHVWILGGDAPAFLRGQQPFYSDAPLWTIELAAPQWSAPRPTE